MSTTKFYISQNGQQSGPWSVAEIVSKVGASELSPMDYLFDEDKNDWVALLEHPEVSANLSALKPKAPPKPKAAPSTNSEHDAVPQELKDKVAKAGQPEYMLFDWYVLKGENRFGPFSYPDVVRMLQEKVVYEFDFAWHSGLETWIRIAEIEAFHTKNIQKLQETLMPEIKQVFFRRRHRRAKFGGSIIIHDNKNVWKGHAVEVSAGGAGVVMDNSMLVPGQDIYLHFKPGDGVPPFNAVCEVVSKKYVDGVKDKNAPIMYGLRFKNISSNTQKFLQDFTKTQDAA